MKIDFIYKLHCLVRKLEMNQLGNMILGTLKIRYW